MEGFDKNVHGKEHDPFENISIPPIEKDKKFKEEFSSKHKNPSRAQIFAALMSFLKKMSSVFTFKGQSTLSLLEALPLLPSLATLYQLFKTLSIEDVSHQPKFIEALSESWNQLIDAHRHSPQSKTHSKLLFFIGQVQNYPLGVDHTLGYYLKEYAGKDWTPFPFMELLEVLHEEFKRSKTHSVLNDWLTLLEEILEIFDEKQDN